MPSIKICITTDPNQRKNCHYLVLFNNPVDRQQVCPQPTTPEHLRMRIDILNPIKHQEALVAPHSLTQVPAQQTYHQPIPLTQQLTKELDFEQANNSEEMPSCDDCGLVFENVHDLQRHVKRWCPENKRKKDDVEMDDDQSDWIPFEPEKKENEDNRESDVFEFLMKKAKEDNENLWEQKYDKYIKEGLSREDARVQMEEKMKSKDLKKFLENYGQLILYILQINTGPIHTRVMEDVQDFLSEGYDERKATRMALHQNRHILDEMWDDEAESEDEESDMEEDSDESEED